MSNTTTAIFLTGAAARISQEVAILDQLILEKGLTISQDDTLLAGFSSGSLNLAAINSCFKTDSPNSWNKYYKTKLLFPLKSKQIYQLLPFTRKSLLNTKPLRKTLGQFLKKMNCEYFGDLAFKAFVLTYSRDDKEQHTHWAYTKDKGNGNLLANDLFMASTAIPIIFPEQEIKNRLDDRNFPFGDFLDGGTHGTFDNFEKYMDTYILENGNIETLHVISPMRQSVEQEDKHLEWQIREMEANQNLDRKHFDSHKDSVKDFLSKISMNSFLKFLYNLQEWNNEGVKVKSIFISIPEMETNFPILSFGKQRKQYKAVTSWLEQNTDKLAMPLDIFLKAHPLE